MKKLVAASLVGVGLVLWSSLAQADPGCSSCGGGSYAPSSCPSCYSAPSVSYQSQVVTGYRPEVRHQTYQETVYHQVTRPVTDYQTIATSVPYTDYERRSTTEYRTIVVPVQKDYVVPVTRYRQESQVVPVTRYVHESVPQTVTRQQSYVQMVPYQHTVQVPVYTSGSSYETGSYGDGGDCPSCH
jgi:hypothetical protein